MSDGPGGGGVAHVADDLDPHGASLDRAIQSRIGEQLRAMYDGLMEQPVPDRFSALLARLEDGGTRES